MVTDCGWYFTQAVANSFKLPRIVLRIGNLFSFIGFSSLPSLREKGFLPIQESQIETPVPNLAPLKVKEIPAMETPDREDFYGLITSFLRESKASAGFIWKSLEALERSELITVSEDLCIPLFPIGPLYRHFPASSSSLLTEDQSYLSWLDTQATKSVLYVSFGSLATFKEDEFTEIAWGLANSNQPFLWVLRPGLVCGSEELKELPDGFLEMINGRGYFVERAPQQEVLAHPATGGFWTHNGWNSTLEGICEGVPMICLPRFADQTINARCVIDVWKIGVHLEDRLERGAIEKAIRRLMVETEGEEMRDRIMQLKKKVKLSLGQGCSSHQALESLISYISSF